MHFISPIFHGASDEATLDAQKSSWTCLRVMNFLINGVQGKCDSATIFTRSTIIENKLRRGDHRASFLLQGVEMAGRREKWQVLEYHQNTKNV